MTSDNLAGFRKYLYKIAILLIAGLSLLIILNELAAYYKILVLPISFNPAYLGYGVCAQITFFLVVSYAWKYNIFITAKTSISLRASFSQISFLMVGKYIPGKVWGMYARSLILVSHDVSYRQSLAGTYHEQLISIHAGLAFGFTAWIITNIPALLVPCLVLVLLSILFSTTAQNGIYRIAANLWYRDEQRKAQTVPFEISLHSYLVLFFLYLLEWVFAGLVLVVLYFSLFDTHASAEFVFLLMGSCAIAFVAGFLAVFAPGGIGVREGVMVTMIAQHIPLGDALILALVFRVWFTCFDVLAGIIGLLLWGKRAKIDTAGDAEKK